MWVENVPPKGAFSIVLLEGKQDLRLRLSLGKAQWAHSFFPLTALLKQLNALETFENAALGSDAAGLFEAGVL